jgi:hypothetical protein
MQRPHLFAAGKASHHSGNRNAPSRVDVEEPHESWRKLLLHTLGVRVQDGFICMESGGVAGWYV